MRKLAIALILVFFTAAAYAGMIPPSSGGSTTLKGLSDVSMGSPVNNEIFVYNGASNKWEARGSISLTFQDPITGVSQTSTPPSPLSGDYELYFNSTAGHWYGLSNTSGVVQGPRQLDVGSAGSSALQKANGTGGFTPYAGGGCGTSFVNAVAADGTLSCAAVAGTAGGTVTSVGLSMPSHFSVTGSPVTASGTLAVTETAQSCAAGAFVNGTDATGANTCATPGGGISYVYTSDQANLTANIASTTMATPSTAGFYCATTEIKITAPGGTTSTLPNVDLLWYGAQDNTQMSGALTASTAQNQSYTYEGGPIFCFYAASGYAIKWSTANYASSGTPQMAYAVSIRLYRLGN
ncbi:MAG: hypothetical protein M0Z75_17360 [Nitrospiraceae bacterium]|nr:hypothetical protein [Nitrospiraceae bacterium]